MTDRPPGCPFETKGCPLYLAAHTPTGGQSSCMTGDWQRGCAVDRAKSRGPVVFDRLFKRISIVTYAQMYGFTCRPIIGPDNRGLIQIWPWMFNLLKEE